MATVRIGVGEFGLSPFFRGPSGACISRPWACVQTDPLFQIDMPLSQRAMAEEAHILKLPLDRKGTSYNGMLILCYRLHLEGH